MNVRYPPEGGHRSLSWARSRLQTERLYETNAPTATKVTGATKNCFTNCGPGASNGQKLTRRAATAASTYAKTAAIYPTGTMKGQQDRWMCGCDYPRDNCNHRRRRATLGKAIGRRYRECTTRQGEIDSTGKYERKVLLAHTKTEAAMIRRNAFALAMVAAAASFCFECAAFAADSTKATILALENSPTGGKPVATPAPAPVKKPPGAKPSLTSSDCRLGGGTVVVPGDDRCGTLGAVYCKGGPLGDQCIEETR
jgi:hypothetical protein